MNHGSTSKNWCTVKISGFQQAQNLAQQQANKLRQAQLTGQLGQATGALTQLDK